MMKKKGKAVNKVMEININKQRQKHKIYDWNLHMKEEIIGLQKKIKD